MSDPIEIDVHAVCGLIQSNQPFYFLDCREIDEYRTAAIAGANLIPMSELQNRIAELEAHRDQRIVIHCHHGGRSLHVANALRGAGFDKAQSMAGGIDAWSQEVDPAVPRY
jgi:rhodanese-related sulfurtransferase